MILAATTNMARTDTLHSASMSTGRHRSSVVGGSLWMIGISLALFFLPAINGFLGGLIGGYKVGGAGRALGAAILPAVIVGLGLWLLLAVLDAPLIGLMSGVALMVLILCSSLGLLAGAAIGGAAANNDRPHIASR
jgi:hypothetical protein